MEEKHENFDHDLIHVIRCKNCKYYFSDGDGTGECNYGWGKTASDDGFCSDAELKIVT